MATTYEVETWQDIVNLATQSQADAFRDNIIIKLTKDIDCNREIPYGVESTLLFNVISSARRITFDGGYEVNGELRCHEIRNLRTHYANPVTIFKGGYSSGSLPLTFKNIDFINLTLDEYLAYSATNNGGGTITLIVTNCRFVGKRSHKIFYGSGSGFAFTSCYFNMPSSNDRFIVMAPSDDTKSKDAYFCWFREKYGGWTVSDSDTGHSSFGNMRVSGCYVDGEIVGDSIITLTSKYAADSAVQNVIDADLSVLAAEGTTITVNAPKGVWRNDIYSTDSSIVGTYSYTNTNNDAIPESPADMTNVNKLSSDGLDVATGGGV